MAELTAEAGSAPAKSPILWASFACLCGRSFRKRYSNLEAQRGPTAAGILQFPQFPQAICQWPVAWRSRRWTENYASVDRGDREFFRTA